MGGSELFQASRLCGAIFPGVLLCPFHPPVHICLCTQEAPSRSSQGDVLGYSGLVPPLFLTVLQPRRFLQRRCLQTITTNVFDHRCHTGSEVSVALAINKQRWRKNEAVLEITTWRRTLVSVLSPELQPVPRLSPLCRWVNHHSSCREG